MKSTVTGRHVEITTEIRGIITQKLARIERLLHDNAVSIQFVLTRTRGRCGAEVVLHVRGDHMLHGEDEGGGWEQAIGGAIDKVHQQAHTLKSRWETRHRNNAR